MIRCSCILLGLTAVVLAEPRTPATPSSAGLVTSRIEDRVIKSFDFDERKNGNYESMPRFWRQIRESGYPRYLEPRFDYEIGHTAPPSLRLQLSGGNLGVTYLAKDIDVHPSADYRITAWIRPSGLAHARAYVTAYYLDHALRKIEASERQSPLVRGAGSDEPWVEVSIHLPGGFENARWLGLSCRVEQMPERSPGPDDLRPINYRDVRAAAWFDDITILRLPHLALELTAPGNVFLDGQSVECLARVADTDGLGLDAKLAVFDAAGAPIENRSVPVVGLEEPGSVQTLPNLAVGWYRVVLTVGICDALALTREQAFVRLSPALSIAEENLRGFGVILDPSPELPLSVREHLLRALGPGVVKVPLWRRDMSDDAIVKGDPRLDDLLRVLHGDGMALVATLEDPPENLARECGHAKMTLLDVLCSPPDQWRPYLAFIIARYGPQIRAWQIGGEDAQAASGDRRLAAALANVRAELKPLIGPADLVAPQPLDQLPTSPEALKAEVISLTVPQSVSAAVLAEQLATPKDAPTLRRWVTVEPPARDRYDRLIRLGELAKRIITARESGVETIFLRQPWKVAADEDSVTVEPDEEFIIYRTVAQCLGGLKPDRPVWVDQGVRARLFVDDAGEVGAIAAWTDGESARSTKAVLDLGTSAQRVDLWGRSAALPEAVGGREFAVGAVPVIIAPVSAPRVRALSSFAVTEPTFQATVYEQPRKIVFTNPRSLKLHGTLLLQPPPGWQLQPRKVVFDAEPGGQARIDVTFRVPSNQAASEYVLQGRLVLEGDDFDGLTMRAPMYVRTPGLDVSVITSSEGRNLTVFQRITNLTKESLNLRAAVLVSGRQRQTRTVTDLAPGQTVVRQFQIDEAATLSGKPIRVTVEQIGGPLRHHTLLRLE